MASTYLTKRRSRARSGDATITPQASTQATRYSQPAFLPAERTEDAHGAIINVRWPDGLHLDTSACNTLDVARMHEVVNACIRIRSDRLVETPMVVETTSDGVNFEIIPNHALNQLFRMPGPTIDTASLWRCMAVSWDAVGLVYLEPTYDVGGVLKGFNPLDPCAIDERFSGRQLAYIDYRPDMGELIRYRPNDLVMRRRVFWADVPPVWSALRAVDEDTSASNYIRSFFRNGGVPSGVLNVDGYMSKKAADDYAVDWASQFGHGGVRQNGVAVLDKIVTYQEVGSKLNEIENEPLRKFIESRICMPFGIPPLIIYSYLGLSSSTYSNLKEAWDSFWDATVTPYLNEWAAWLTRTILPAYEDADEIAAGRVRVRFDTTGLGPYQEDVAQKSTIAKDGFDQGVISINETRQAMGYEAVDDPQADEIAALAPEPEPEPELPPAIESATDAAEDASDQIAEQKAVTVAPSVLERHVAEYLRGEYAKARRVLLSTGDAEAAIAALEDALDDGVQLAAILAPSIRKSTTRGYGQAGRTKAVALPGGLRGAVDRAVEAMVRHAKGIAETTRAEITALIRAGGDLLSAGRDRALARAPMITQTETKAAETTGTLTRYSDDGVQKVRWTTGGNPCPDCAPREGQLYPLADVESGSVEIPLHPNCNCYWQGAEV